ncbi:MAG: hypothetical protein JWM11_3206 [Planctomycetaceae bacterium]|nr:hypothetical protein [Planctomycetaceae bacterium]
MTRNSPQTPDSDDPWGQLEADLFGIEVGKEHTAHERVASEVPLETPPQASIAIPKPLEDDDFGDFGAGLVEELAPSPRAARRSVSAAESSRPPVERPAGERPARSDRARKPERAEEVAPVEAAPVERVERPARAQRPPRHVERPAEPVEAVEPPVAKAPVAKTSVAKTAPKKPVKDDFADFDEGPTDEDLDAAIDEDVDDVDEAEAKSPPSPEDDPYWDALANWNWQDDDRSSKPRDGEDRGRPASSGGDRSRGDRGGRGRADRSRPDRSGSDRAPAERPQPPARETRAASAPEERPAGERVPASRRSGPDRAHSDRERPAERERTPERSEPIETPRSVSPAAAREPDPREPDTEESEESIDVTSRRRDRRRSRRQGPATAAEETPKPVAPKTISLSDLDPDFEAGDDAWPHEETRAAVSDNRARIVESDPDFDDSSAEGEGESGEASDEEGEGQARRKRGRKRRRRPERPAVAKSELSVDEDLKHLEDDSFEPSADEELDSKSADPEGDEEESAEDRAKRSRRRRRRGRNDRPERPAPVVAARVEPDLDLDDEEAEDVEDPFVDESDLDFDDEAPPRKKNVRQRPARVAATVRKVVDEDEEEDDEGEPEPLVSYDDVPSWEEAISYLLNPSMVEGVAGDRTSQERGVENRGAERTPERADRGRAPDRAPREAGPRDNGPREGGPREGGPREGGSRPPRRSPRRDA